MANIGRFVCVAVPFALTVAALIALLIATLSGVTDKHLYMFRVDLSNFSISTESMASLISSSLDSRSVQTRDLSSILSSIQSQYSSSSSSVSSLISSVLGSDSNGNITASDLGLANIYDVSLWGYCATYSNSTRKCISPEFNWAKSYINITELEAVANATNSTIELPSSIINSLKVFVKVSKWTEVVFIIALIGLAAELFFGIFSSCSRALSCVTWVFATIASLATGAAALMSTIVSGTVVAAIRSTAAEYNAKASLNNRFIATVWIAVAFCVGASLFWLFSACCCKGSSLKSKRRSIDGEKLLGGHNSYTPLGPQQGYSHGAATGYPGAQRAPNNGMAYEPYTHRQ